ncbi:hypothetical protein, partial [Haloferula sp.]|uniref:hypothetical protein n=1 Tax=Haloferula sp. TaxID=2497595 RepID=UPI003C790CBE
MKFNEKINDTLLSGSRVAMRNPRQEMQNENTVTRYETGTFLFVTERATLSRFSSQAKRDSVARSFPLQRPFS